MCARVLAESFCDNAGVDLGIFVLWVERKATPTLFCNHAHSIEKRGSTKARLMSLYLSKSCCKQPYSINSKVIMCMSITSHRQILSSAIIQGSDVQFYIAIYIYNVLLETMEGLNLAVQYSYNPDTL